MPLIIPATLFSGQCRATEGQLCGCGLYEVAGIATLIVDRRPTSDHEIGLCRIRHPLRSDSEDLAVGC